MAEILELVDLDQLRKEVREKYREVAQDPTAEYHFHTGRAHALRLGYPPSPLDQLPEEACAAFAGVGNPFFWGGPKSGERVVDLGSEVACLTSVEREIGLDRDRELEQLGDPLPVLFMDVDPAAKDDLASRLLEHGG